MFAALGAVCGLKSRKKSSTFTPEQGQMRAQQHAHDLEATSHSSISYEESENTTTTTHSHSDLSPSTTLQLPQPTKPPIRQNISIHQNISNNLQPRGTVVHASPGVMHPVKPSSVAISHLTGRLKTDELPTQHSRTFGLGAPLLDTRATTNNTMLPRQTLSILEAATAFRNSVTVLRKSETNDHRAAPELVPLTNKMVLQMAKQALLEAHKCSGQNTIRWPSRFRRSGNAALGSIEGAKISHGLIVQPDKHPATGNKGVNARYSNLDHSGSRKEASKYHRGSTNNSAPRLQFASETVLSEAAFGQQEAEAGGLHPTGKPDGLQRYLQTYETHNNGAWMSTQLSTGYIAHQKACTPAQNPNPKISFFTNRGELLEQPRFVLDPKHHHWLPSTSSRDITRRACTRITKRKKATGHQFYSANQAQFLAKLTFVLPPFKSLKRYFEHLCKPTSAAEHWKRFLLFSNIRISTLGPNSSQGAPFPDFQVDADRINTAEPSLLADIFLQKSRNQSREEQTSAVPTTPKTRNYKARGGETKAANIRLPDSRQSSISSPNYASTWGSLGKAIPGASTVAQITECGVEIQKTKPSLQIPKLESFTFVAPKVHQTHVLAESHHSRVQNLAGTAQQITTRGPMPVQQTSQRVEPTCNVGTDFEKLINGDIDLEDVKRLYQSKGKSLTPSELRWIELTQSIKERKAAEARGKTTPESITLENELGLPLDSKLDPSSAGDRQATVEEIAMVPAKIERIVNVIQQTPEERRAAQKMAQEGLDQDKGFVVVDENGRKRRNRKRKRKRQSIELGKEEALGNMATISGQRHDRCGEKNGTLNTGSDELNENQSRRLHEENMASVKPLQAEINSEHRSLHIQTNNISKQPPVTASSGSQQRQRTAQAGSASHSRTVGHQSALTSTVNVTSNPQAQRGTITPSYRMTKERLMEKLEFELSPEAVNAKYSHLLAKVFTEFFTDPEKMMPGSKQLTIYKALVIKEIQAYAANRLQYAMDSYGREKFMTQIVKDQVCRFVQTKAMQCSEYSIVSIDSVLNEVLPYTKRSNVGKLSLDETKLHSCLQSLAKSVGMDLDRDFIFDPDSAGSKEMAQLVLASRNSNMAQLKEQSEQKNTLNNQPSPARADNSSASLTRSVVIHQAAPTSSNHQPETEELKHCVPVTRTKPPKAVMKRFGNYRQDIENTTVFHKPTDTANNAHLTQERDTIAPSSLPRSITYQSNLVPIPSEKAVACIGVFNMQGWDAGGLGEYVFKYDSISHEYGWRSRKRWIESDREANNITLCPPYFEDSQHDLGFYQRLYSDEYISLHLKGMAQLPFNPVKLGKRKREATSKRCGIHDCTGCAFCPYDKNLVASQRMPFRAAYRRPLPETTIDQWKEWLFSADRGVRQRMLEVANLRVPIPIRKRNAQVQTSDNEEDYGSDIVELDSDEVLSDLESISTSSFETGQVNLGEMAAQTLVDTQARMIKDLTKAQQANSLTAVTSSAPPSKLSEHSQNSALNPKANAISTVEKKPQQQMLSITGIGPELPATAEGLSNSSASKGEQKKKKKKKKGKKKAK